MTRTTARLSALRIYQALTDIEKKLLSQGFDLEASVLTEEKRKLMLNIADMFMSEKNDSFSNGAVIERTSNIDWGGF